LRRHASHAASDAAVAILDRAGWHACRAELPTCGPLSAAWANAGPEPDRLEERVTELGDLAGPKFLPRLRRLLLHRPPGSRQDPVPPSEALEWTRLYVDLYTHAAPFDPARLLEIWKHCDSGAESKEVCARGRHLAEQIARGEPPSLDWLKREAGSSRRIGSD
jgi:hypothetical protein